MLNVKQTTKNHAPFLRFLSSFTKLSHVENGCMPDNEVDCDEDDHDAD